MGKRRFLIRTKSTLVRRNSASMSSIMCIFTTLGGFIQHSCIVRWMKSISELVIGKLWDIVKQGFYTNLLIKVFQPRGEV